MTAPVTAAIEGFRALHDVTVPHPAPRTGYGLGRVFGPYGVHNLPAPPSGPPLRAAPARRYSPRTMAARRTGVPAAKGGTEGTCLRLPTFSQGRWSLIDVVQSAGLGAPPTWPPGSPPPSPRDASPRGRDGSVQYYIEQPRVKDHSFGVAPFIRAGIEMEDLMKKTSLSDEESKLEQAQCRTEGEVLDAERLWREAWVAGDAAALDRIHAADYIAIPNIGTTSTRAEVMADVKRGVFRYSRMQHSEQSVRFFGGTAVVAGRTTNEGRRGDRDVSGDFRYTRIYVKRDGRWQAVLSQYTSIGS
jgi:ketosteroid isomerase-like protein